MTPWQIRNARLRLGLTTAQAGALLGVSARTWRRWESAERAPGEPAIRLMRLMLMLPSVCLALARM